MRWDRDLILDHSPSSLPLSLAAIGGFHTIQPFLLPTKSRPLRPSNRQIHVVIIATTLLRRLASQMR